MLTLHDIVENQQNPTSSKFSDPALYINRELSWMNFNKRVLHQACRSAIPLLERCNFLGITYTNLDEFIMVRFSSILNKLNRNVTTPDLSGLYPADEYQQVRDQIKSFKKMQEECYQQLRKELQKEKIEIIGLDNLKKEDKEQASRIFSRYIYPLITPIAVDTMKSFPIIKTGQLNMIVSLQDDENSDQKVLSIIPIDRGMDRLYELDSVDGEHRFITLEDIVTMHLGKIFINKKVLYTGTMRILREADIELDHNRDIYIVDRMRQTLRKRELSQPIFMDVDYRMPKEILRLITKMFNMEKSHVYKSKEIIDLSFLKSVPVEDRPGLRYRPFTPQRSDELVGEMDIFSAIDNGDILIHHPYESFDPVIKFLEHAAEDKKVRAIKQTLYRVSSSDSPIVEALCRAAKKGKQVSVLLEIKARFDEGRNISLIEKMESAGCKLIYGAEDLKTHCKFIMVVRDGNRGLKKYCHIGTGNYNEKSSHVYTDLSYFTSNTKICDDILSVFNVLSGFSTPRDEISKIFYAPYNIRTQIYSMIDREIDFAKKGKKAFITLKLNSLSDQGIIERLYKAANKGVKISIICRGICSMKPIHKNITIRSLVGRYLEHSRIYYFYNNGKSDLFISSADMLTRNLDRRVELMVPITDQSTRDKLLHIIGMYFRDTLNAYVMDKDGQYTRSTDLDRFNVQEYFMDKAISNYKLRSISINRKRI